jgi:hypothetical protein
MTEISLQSTLVRPPLFQIIPPQDPNVAGAAGVGLKIETERQFTRDEEAAFQIDALQLSEENANDDNVRVKSLYNELKQIQSAKNRFQNILMMNQKSQSSVSATLSKEERFKIEIEKAVSEIMLLSELTSSLRNQERFTLVHTLQKQLKGRGFQLPTTQKLNIIGDMYLKSKGIFDKGLADIKSSISQKRKLSSLLIQNISSHSRLKGNQWKLLFVENKKTALVYGRRYEIFRDNLAINCSIISNKLFSRITNAMKIHSNLSFAKYDFTSHFLVPLALTPVSSEDKKPSSDMEMEIDDGKVEGNIKQDSITVIGSQKKSRTIKISLLVNQNASSSSHAFEEIISETFWDLLHSDHYSKEEDEQFRWITDFCFRRKHESLMLILFQILKNEIQDLTQFIFLKIHEVRDFQNAEALDYSNILKLFLNGNIFKTFVLNKFLSEEIVLQLNDNFYLQIQFSDCQEKEEEGKCVNEMEIIEDKNSKEKLFFRQLMKTILLYLLHQLYSFFNEEKLSNDSSPPSELSNKPQRVSSNNFNVHNFEDHETLKIRQKYSQLSSGTGGCSRNYLIGILNIIRRQNIYRRISFLLHKQFSGLASLPLLNQFVSLNDRKTEEHNTSATTGFHEEFQSFSFTVNFRTGVTLVLSYRDDCLVSIETLAAPSSSVGVVKLIDSEDQFLNFLFITTLNEFSRSFPYLFDLFCWYLRFFLLCRFTLQNLFQGNPEEAIASNAIYYHCLEKFSSFFYEIKNLYYLEVVGYCQVNIFQAKKSTTQSIYLSESHIERIHIFFNLQFQNNDEKNRIVDYLQANNSNKKLEIVSTPNAELFEDLSLLFGHQMDFNALSIGNEKLLLLHIDLSS